MEISVCCTPQPGGGPRVSMLVLLCFCSPQLFCLLQFQPLFLWCLSAAFHVESFAMTSELRSPQASQPLHHGQEEERLQHNTTMTQCYKSLLLLTVAAGYLSCHQCFAFQIVSPLAASSSTASRPLSTKLFLAQRMTPTRKTRREDSFDREDGQDDDGSEESAEDIIFDYSEAQSKMKEEENKRRVEEGLTVGLTKEVRYYHHPFYCAVLRIRWSLNMKPHGPSQLLFSSGRRRVQCKEGSIRRHESQNQSTGISGGI
jgi:hypothetical protein